MNAPASLTIPHLAATSNGRSVLAPLAVGLLLLGAVFTAEIEAAVSAWRDSTAYNHCFLVIPIALYLLWDRRNDLADLSPAPWPIGAMLALPAASIWLIAERLGIMEGRQIAVVSLVEVLFLTVLGPGFYRAVAGPLLYLAFLVPFGEFLTPDLQDVTTFFVRHGLDVLGIPAFIDGHTIEIPQGTFFVAEACAGLRFLIASIAFGCLYALLMYRSPVRRALFIVLSVAVPIAANGVRALGIVYLGYLLDSAQAAAADHIIYGWIFFSCVVLLLSIMGLPFRQDQARGQIVPRRPVGLDRPVSFRIMLMSAIGVVAIGTAGPVLVAGLPTGMPAAHPHEIHAGGDCLDISHVGAGQGGTLQVQRFGCGDMTVDVTWQALSPRLTAAPLMAARRRMTQRAATESSSESWIAAADQPTPWRLMTSNNPVYIIAAGIWVDGKPARPGLRLRAAMAWNSLFGSAHAPIVASVTPAVDWDKVRFAERDRLQAQLETFLLTHPQLESSIAAASNLP